MNRVVVACIVIIAGLLGIAGGSAVARADAPPIPPTQGGPDIFPCSWCSVDRDGDGDRDMQDENPVTRTVKQTRTAAYRIVVLPGCNRGNYDGILNYMNTVEAPKVGLNLSVNQTAFNFTVYISCGQTQINKCGSINTFCLPDGFPYNCDVYMSDVLSGWDVGSQQGIPIHEIIEHCLQTSNEGYCRGFNDPAPGCVNRFDPVPNHRDVMNTGPLSRHGIEANECGRWMRNMWQDIPCAVTYGYAPAPPVAYPYWNASRGCWEQGYWCWDPSTNTHYDPNGYSEWGPPVYLSDGSFTQYNWRLDKTYRGGFRWAEKQPDGSYVCLSGCW